MSFSNITINNIIINNYGSYNQTNDELDQLGPSLDESLDLLNDLNVLEDQLKSLEQIALKVLTDMGGQSLRAPTQPSLTKINAKKVTESKRTRSSATKTTNSNKSEKPKKNRLGPMVGRICGWCKSPTTKCQWRGGPVKDEPLCNKCGLQYRKIKQVTSKASSKND